MMMLTLVNPPPSPPREDSLSLLLLWALPLSTFSASVTYELYQSRSESRDSFPREAGDMPAPGRCLQRPWVSKSGLVPETLLPQS